MASLQPGESLGCTSIVSLVRGDDETMMSKHAGWRRWRRRSGALHANVLCIRRGLACSTQSCLISTRRGRPYKHAFSIKLLASAAAVQPTRGGAEGDLVLPLRCCCLIQTPRSSTRYLSVAHPCQRPRALVYYLYRLSRHLCFSFCLSPSNATL